MHYRVSVYNYFHRRFAEESREFAVLADVLQKQNQQPIAFPFQEIPFGFGAYRRAITAASPAAVILFLRLKDKIIWPLAHWLRWRRIPFAFWTKGGNWDQGQSRLRYEMFNYLHGLSNALILYSEDCHKFIRPRYHHKTFVANNTVNFADYPEVREDKDAIKREFGIRFKKVVIFVGRMGVGGGRKRVDHAIEVFRQIQNPELGLVLVGSGLSPELQARMNPANTLYLGEVHDPKNEKISKLFKMADLCMIPGHLGLGLNQAFHWGLPVLTEEGDHPPEAAYLVSGRNGFMVPENDIAALREKTLYLLENDAARAEFSHHARTDIHHHASIEGMFQGFLGCVRFLQGE
jgi:glycosyltransferase involved in cell wall biosynthesis